MSIVTREMLGSAASSPHGLTAGTIADPIQLSWSEVHDQAKRIAGGLAARGVGRHGSVAVLATDAADVAPLAQAVWLRRAALTMLQQPTPRTDLAVWLGDNAGAREFATFTQEIRLTGSSGRSQGNLTSTRGR